MRYCGARRANWPTAVRCGKSLASPREAFGERWHPYRSVASWYMWRALQLPRADEKGKAARVLSDIKLSLTHLVREPGRRGRTPPPLLLLLHGIGSNEEDLFGLAPYLDERFLVVSARAPVMLGPGSYGWFQIEFTPRGMVADVEQAKRSLGLLPGFIDGLIETYRADGGRVYLAGFSQGAMMGLA